MSNLSTAARSGFGRNGFDLAGFDPFRGLFGGLGYLGGIEIARTESGYDVEIPVAGFTPEQIEITAEDGVLTVSAKSEKRSFRRSFVLPEEIDTDSIDAKIENGLLTLTLPLHPKAQPKRIAIRTISEKG